MKKEENKNLFLTNDEMIEIYVANRTELARQQRLNKYIKDIIKSFKSRVKEGYTSMRMIYIERLNDEDCKYVFEHLVGLGYEVQIDEINGWTIHLFGV